ncbi:M56 family metallopeptidase [Frateuria hangzhouensis]|uniref:M56 family metallopeptidase n=1 Tax=Frateuria hangzhouensis TaxID=2995589 RepID=UPI002260FA95|nr:M56 family metallopeptidase [Frateuria sp. STR12]MCX7513194.1 peptidase M56 [Frateuria sp. STR12]
MATFTLLLDALSARLLWTSAQACLLIGAVALACRLLPRLPAAIRCALWWLVGAQLVLGLAWHTPLQLRWLPAPAQATVSTTRAAPVVVLPMSTQAVPVPSPRAIQAPANPSPLPWPRLLLALWLAGVALQLALLARQAWHAARARGAARPAPADWQAVCRVQAQRLGLRRAPRLAFSPAIRSPQVLGAWRPLVLFPTDARLSDEETAMAIAHELAHLRRGDLWLGWIPALAQRLFFFHPLVAWAMREYALSREAACDAQALVSTGGAPQAYGRLLLRMGVAAPLPSGLAGASPTFHNLKRRLTMLQHIEATSRRSRGWLLLVAIAIAGVVPYRVTATSADTPVASTQAGHVQPAPAPPAPPAPPAAPPAPPAFAPPAPPAPPPHAPPPPPPPPLEFDGLSASQVYIDSSAPGESVFALLDDESIVVTAPRNELAGIERLRKETGGPLLWFRHDGKAYISRDLATIAEAQKAYAPVSGMARQQGRLAGEQGKLAGKQAGLAQRDAAIARAQAVVARQQAALAREAAFATPAAETEVAAQAREARQRALEQQQDRLEQKHAALEKATAAQRQELEKQQAAFEAKQQALAQRQQQAREQAEKQMQQVLEEAVRNGKARAVSATAN